MRENRMILLKFDHYCAKDSDENNNLETCTEIETYRKLFLGSMFYT